MSLPYARTALLLLWLSAPALALEADRQKPINVDAGQAEFDEATGITVLSGGVQLEQGSLHITTDTATIHRDPEMGTVQRIILEGSPAVIRQLLDRQPGEMEARAQRIEYDLLGEKIILIEDAELEQGQRRFSGARFEYDIANSRVNAQASPEGDGRVRMVFDPAAENQRTENGD